MVNIEEFAKRLKIIMDYYELSATLLADKIEVQRSSISHLLSGRNKPSLEFVLKILKAFPEVELYWLVNGIGKFPKRKENESSSPTLFSTQEPAVETEKKVAASAFSGDTNRAIERIVIFYKDGTFTNYSS